jgi:hypothetical protein
MQLGQHSFASWKSQQVHAALSVDGRTAVVCGRGELAVYDVQAGRERAYPGNENESPGLVGVSPDGRTAAVCPSRLLDCFVRLVDTATGGELLVLKGHDLNLSALAWSADGRVVATGDTLNARRSTKNPAVPSVRLWDAVTGKELARFGGVGAEVASLALSPDGTRLVAGLGDSTILVWDVSKVVPAAVVQKLDDKALAGCWEDLAGGDAARAYQSAWKLIATPQQTVPLLAERLQPAPAVAADQLRQWVADLGSDQAPVRAAAVKELAKAGAQAEPALRQALKETKTPVARQHLERLLSKLEGLAPETLRTLRAVQVLERIGSPTAREVLGALAKGPAGTRATEDARAALTRLTRR